MSIRALAAPAFALAAFAFAACGDNKTSGSDTCPNDCVTAPAPICRDGDLVTFAPLGDCTADGCVHDESTRPCEFGCDDGECLADPGPCAGVTCDTPPAAFCNDDGLAVQYAAAGTCDPASGSCSYSVATVTCAADEVCFEGGCVPLDCSFISCDAPPSPRCDLDTAIIYAQAGTCDPELLSCTYAEFPTDCAANGQICISGACVDDTRCDDVTCRNTRPPFCDGNTVVEPDLSGTCTAGICSYGETRTDCGAERVCQDGVCIGPCDGVACNTPPPQRCDGPVAITYAVAGECADGVCSYDESRRDCAADGLICTTGTCVADPTCEGVTCNAPPLDVCDGNVAVLSEAIGACADGLCSYRQSLQDCTATGETCVDGACVNACEGVVCSDPPADFCSGNTATFYGLGACAAGSCDYESFSQDCSLTGDFCVEGFCRSGCVDSACVSPPENFCSLGRAIQYNEAGYCEGDGCVYDEAIDDCAARGTTCVGGQCVESCAGGLCNEPPAPSCVGDLLTEYGDVGTCDELAGECIYIPVLTDCAAAGQACDAGECVDLCVVTSCAPVPPATCDGETLVQYSFPADCADGVCSYTELRVDCTESGRVCEGGACVDACIGVVCNAPPPPSCNGETVVQPRSPGICRAGVCDYTGDEFDCSRNGQTCENAECVDPCVGVTCNTPPDDRCDGNTIVRYSGAGACLNGDCVYSAFTADCGEGGFTCVDAECFDLCAGVTCDAPPVPSCDGDVAVLGDALGVCSAGLCSYGSAGEDCSSIGGWCVAGGCTDACADNPCPDRTGATSCDGNTRLTVVPGPPACTDGECFYSTSAFDCTSVGQICVSGACVANPAPCTSVGCSAPVPYCESDIVVTTGPGGVCNATTGLCDFSLVETRTDCDPPLGCVAGACQRVASAGDLIITEIFYDAAASDYGREWFEVRNVSTVALSIAGIEVQNSLGQSFTVSSSATVAAGAYFVFASGATAANGLGGYVYDFELFNLANGPGSLTLLRNGRIIDSVARDGAFPTASGGSIALDPGSETFGGNDSAAAWCVSEPVYGAGERGTPRAARTTCR